MHSLKSSCIFIRFRSLFCLCFWILIYFSSLKMRFNWSSGVLFPFWRLTANIMAKLQICWMSRTLLPVFFTSSMTIRRYLNLRMVQHSSAWKITTYNWLKNVHYSLCLLTNVINVCTVPEKRKIYLSRKFKKIFTTAIGQIVSNLLNLLQNLWG